MHIKTSFILLSIFIFAGCKNSMFKSDEISDDQLMQDIIDAEKIDINITDMPYLSRTVIDQDYNDYIEIDAKMASGLGYQVSMDGKGYKPGDHNEVYFNMKGRKLISKKYDRNKDGFKCFELVLPVAFVMPDGSTMNIEEENGYRSIRTWYGNNPDSKVNPTLKYPINIIYSGKTKIINNDEEMRSTKSDCSKWDDDKKDWDCFILVYPITFIMLDGSDISIQDEEDLMAWYKLNQDIEENIILQYPVEINYRDGSTKRINNDEDMQNAKEDCKD